MSAGHATAAVFALAAAVVPARAGGALEVTAITPDRADNCGRLVETTISGTGFEPGAAVRLIGAGEPDIEAVDVQVQSGQSLMARFYLVPQVSPGVREVAVANPGGATGNLPGAFTVSGCAVVPAGNLFAVETYFGYWVTEFDGRTGEPLRVLVPPNVFTGSTVFGGQDLAFGPNGNIFVACVEAFGFEYGVVEIDRDTGAASQFVIMPDLKNDPYVQDIAFGGPDNNLFAGTYFGDIWEFDGLTGELVGLFAVHPDNILSIAWAPNGNLIVSGYPPMEYDGLTGAPVAQLPDPVGADDIKFGPNGNIFATRVDTVVCEVAEFDGTTGDFVRIVAPVADEIDGSLNLTFRANGHLLVSGHLPDVVGVYPVFEYLVEDPVTYVGRFVDQGITGGRIHGIAQEPIILPGDLDLDGDVDLDDFGFFAACYNGSMRPPADACPEGIDADLDNDGDVDLDDFAIFAANYTGSL